MRHFEVWELPLIDVHSVGRLVRAAKDYYYDTLSIVWFTRYLSYNPRWMQEQIREQNRNKILSQLSQGPKRFTDIQTSTKLSPAGLTEILLRLRKDKLITKILVEGKEAYTLTESGMRQYGEIWLLLERLFELKERKAAYLHQGDIIGWGIEPDFVDDSNKDTLQLLPGIYDFEEAIFELFRKQFDKNKLAVSPTLKGSVVLAFTIDYGKLLSFLRKDKLEQERSISSIDPRKILVSAKSELKDEPKQRTRAGKNGQSR